MVANVVARPRRALGGAIVLCWLLWHAPRGAHADANQSLYEQERAEHALEQAGLQLEPDPEGKRVAFITFARDEVLLGDELLVPLVLPRRGPTWPNKFHWLTDRSEEHTS